MTQNDDFQIKAQAWQTKVIPVYEFPFRIIIRISPYTL